MGPSFYMSPLGDEDQTDGKMRISAVQQIHRFASAGIGKQVPQERAGKRNDTRPFFMSVGFHKPHLPHVVPAKYFDMYGAPPPPNTVFAKTLPIPLDIFSALDGVR